MFQQSNGDRETTGTSAKKEKFDSAKSFPLDHVIGAITIFHNTCALILSVTT